MNESQAQNPILPLHLFRNRVFAVDAVLSLSFGMAFLSVIFYLPLFIQDVLGKSATQSGQVITPLTFALVILLERCAIAADIWSNTADRTIGKNTGPYPYIIDVNL